MASSIPWQRSWVLFKIVAFHSVMFVLHALDLYTTSQIPMAREVNPLGRILWSQYGFVSLIVVKGLVWEFMFAYHLALQKWLPDFSKVVWVSQFVGLAAMIALVVRNFMVL